MKKLIYSSILFTFTYLCYSYIKHEPTATEIVKDSLKILDTNKVFTKPSNLQNQYIGFNSPEAINRIAEIENEYFNSYPNSYSQYYGTQWLRKLQVNGDSLEFEHYVSELQKLNKTPKGLHCTHYAIEALRAGLDSDFDRMDAYHKQIWKGREYAGWSVGYILTKYFGWKAYLVLSDMSKEKDYCINNYKKDKEYNVWNQPDIPVERLYDFDKEKDAIDSLLNQHEYGWGFSNQGWHTWITRFDTLKECYWDGIPSQSMNTYNDKPLFIKTKFTEFTDYHSHIVVFPPKNEND